MLGVTKQDLSRLSQDYLGLGVSPSISFGLRQLVCQQTEPENSTCLMCISCMTLGALGHGVTLVRLQDVSRLSQDHPGIDVSPSISFGLRQLVPQQTDPGDAQQYAYMSSYGVRTQQNSQAPFSKLISSSSDQLASQDHVHYFRQLVVKNSHCDNVQLIDVSFSQKLPMWPNTMALIDDAGIVSVVQQAHHSQRNASVDFSRQNQHQLHHSGYATSPAQDQQKKQKRKKKKQPKSQQNQQQQSTFSSPGKSSTGSSGEATAEQQPPDLSQGAPPGMLGVTLRQGEEYGVTVVLDCLDGPHRK